MGEIQLAVLSSLLTWGQKVNFINYLIVKTCYNINSGANIGDSGSGIILLTVALIMLCGCLICLVKLLNSILGERVKEIIKNGVNRDIPIKYVHVGSYSESKYTFPGILGG